MSNLSITQTVNTSLILGISLTDTHFLNPTPDILSDMTSIYQTSDGALYQSNGSALVPLGTSAPSQPGLTSAAVQQLINTSLAIQTQTFNQQLTQITSVLGSPPYLVGTQSYATVPLAIAALNQAASQGGTAGPSAPTITGAPTISPTTVAVGATNIVVTAGTSTGGTNVTRSYRWIVAGVAQASIWQPVGGAAQSVAAGGGVATATTQVLVLEELVSYTGSVAPISNKSANETLSAGAAVPANTILPSISGTASPNSVLTFSAGSWSNSPTTFDYNVYDGAKPALGGVLLTTQNAASGTVATLTIPSAYAGKTLVLGVVAHNVPGPSVEAYAQGVAVSGGVAPVQIAPYGFLLSGGTGTSPVATALLLDYGLLPGTAITDFWTSASGTGFIVTLSRDGAPFLTAANLTTYTPVLLDQDKTLSYSVVASSGGLASAPSTNFPNPSIEIVAQVGGGGGGTLTTSFVGATSFGTNTAATVSIAVGNITPAVQTNDEALIVRSVNNTGGWTGTPTGFTSILGTAFTLTGNGKSVDAYTKTLTGSEPASYVCTPAAAPDICGAVLLAWRRSDGTAASWVAHANGTPNNSANASPFVATFPTVTSTGSGQRCVLVLVLDPSAGESATFTGLPAGYTLVAQQDFIGGTNWQPIAVFEGPAPSSAATGSQTISVTTSTGTAGWGTYSFIVG